MHIRVAKLEDLPLINSIYNQAVEEQLTADTVALSLRQRNKWFEEHDSSHYPVFVCEQNFQTVGWLSFSKYRPGRQATRVTAEISYYVDRNFRRRGIGTQLLQFALQSAPKYGFKNLFAILLENNAASIRLLEKHSFEKWGRLPRVADFNGTACGHVYYGINL